MAPKYKLTYFDFSGLGEPIRFIFHYANIPFEDNRVSNDDWPKLKPSKLFIIITNCIEMTFFQIHH